MSSINYEFLNFAKSLKNNGQDIGILSNFNARKLLHVLRKIS